MLAFTPIRAYFEVLFKKRRSNTEGDALSRLSTAGITMDLVDDNTPCLIIAGFTADMALRTCEYLSDDEDDNIEADEYGICKTSLALKGAGV